MDKSQKDMESRVNEFNPRGKKNGNSIQEIDLLEINRESGSFESDSKAN